MIKLILLLFICWKSAEGLLCYSCSNEPSFDACFKRGRLTRCQVNEHACHTEVIRFLRPQGVVYSITKRCKQTDACENNFIQNPRAAWKPSQCNLNFPSSVCRCCCTRDKCNYGGFYCVVGPSCNRIPVIEQNGLTRCTLGRNTNSICTNKCDSDFALIGPPTFSCLDTANGLKWNTTGPAGCIKNKCNEDALQIEDGFATCSDGVNRGSICEFSCKENHVLQNGWPVTSCNSPNNITSVRWDSDIPTCARFTCPALESSSNSMWRCSDGNRIGSSCGLRCDEGFYKVPEKGRAKCELNRNLLPPIWKKIPKCEPIKCPALSSPDNGNMECSNSNIYTSTCKFSCSAGFLLTNNNTPTCTTGKTGARDGNGEWDTEAPFCRSAFCKPAIENVAMGNVSCTDSNRYRSVCSFSCAEGWKLEGSITLMCGDSAAGVLKWNRPIPICKPITCRTISSLLNGDVTCSGNVFGDTCSFKCDELYYRSGAPTITCGDSNNDGFGAWLIQPPTCRALKCPSRPSLANGNVFCTNSNMYKSVCTSTCSAGFKKVGVTMSTCGRSGNVGKWSNTLPRCLNIVCPKLSPLVHGSTSCTDAEAYGSRCSSRCDVGYELIGFPTTTCQSSEKWSNQLPVCRELECNVLPPISNGQFVCSRENKYNSVCSHTCSTGYRMEGTSLLKCDGKNWSSTPPTCEQITCSLMSSPLNGEVACSGRNYGDKCSFKCDELYYVDGPLSTTCGDHNGDGLGNWLLEAPTCKAIKCPSRPGITNGIVDCTNGDMYKSVCSSSCLVGFKKSGVSTSTCERLGSVGAWSDPLPQCLDIACLRLSPLSHGSTRCTNAEAYGSRCSFTCNIGYELKGLPSTTCQSSENWSNQVPVCTEMKCSPLLPIRSGTVICTNGNKYNSVCTYKCALGYRVDGADTLTCDGTQWSSPPPVCRRITCPPITSLLNGAVSCGGSDFGAKCSFSCGDLYYVGGSLTTTCIDVDGDGEGDWSNQTPTCRPIRCPGRASIKNGNVVCTNENMYKSVCTSSCSPGYKMHGRAKATCEKLSNTGRWSFPTPQCLLKMCNNISAPDLGKMSCTNGFNIDSVCNFTCEAKHRIYPRGSERLTCLDDETWDKPTPCCFEDCPPNAVMDMIIALDSSSSITRTNFAIVIDFVKTLVKSFQIDNDMTKFGVFRYNRFVDKQNEIRLNGYKDLPDLLNKIDKIPYNGEGTCTGQALQHALDFSLHPSNGNRRGAPDAILLITDGVTNIGDDLAAPTKGIHDRDIKLLAVFVPPFDKRKRELGIEQLVSITRDPASVVLVENGFDSLIDIEASVENFACTKECHRDEILHNAGEADVSLHIEG